MDARQVTAPCDTFVDHNESSRMKKFRHLTYEDRIYIEAWHWERKSLSYMASRLGVRPSTISRELRRGKTGTLGIGYRADYGEDCRQRKAMNKGPRCKLVGRFAEQVIELLKEEWSPKQMAVFFIFIFGAEDDAERSAFP
jgi:IS30 family transposase